MRDAAAARQDAGWSAGQCAEQALKSDALSGKCLETAMRDWCSAPADRARLGESWCSTMALAVLWAWSEPWDNLG